MLKIDKWISKQSARWGLVSIIVAALLIELTSIGQFLFARFEVRRQLEAHAAGELRFAKYLVEDQLREVQLSVAGTSWACEHNLQYPERLQSILMQNITLSDVITNYSFCFVPNYYPDKGHWYEPLATRRDSLGTIEFMQVGGPDHDYFESDFYKKAMACDSTYWTEPYWNEVGRQMMTVSYCKVMHDRNGRQVGVACADISLDWLSKLANRKPLTKSSAIMMLSREGMIMVYPHNEQMEFTRSVKAPNGQRHWTVDQMYKRMLSGEQGQMDIIGHDREDWLSFYQPVGNGTGWSIAVICPKGEIYASLERLQLLVSALMLIGLALIGFVVWKTISDMRRLHEANIERERIDSELRVASGIQMGMLPKVGAHGQGSDLVERDDVDIAATLVPAKQVGGDLYDFFVRDEKLFFCIGDVSGKGVPAALVMAVTRSLFRTASAHESHPARIVENMNDAMAEMDDQSMFVTFFLGVLDLPTGHLRYCGAGHDAPLLIDRQQAVTTLPLIPNLPLAVMAGYQYQEQDVHIQPQTTLFLFTDGLTEAMDTAQQMFRIQRVEQVAQRHQGCAGQLIKQMNQAVAAFSGQAEQSDDLTMVAIKYVKPERTVRLQRSVTLPNDIKALPQLSQFISQLGDDLQLETKETLQLQLAIEEAVVNVMNYAYPAGTQGSVAVEAIATNRQLELIITDDGTPFDPTARTKADTSLSVEERPIGGLGIHLIRQMMDAINYERVQGKNILTLKKIIAR